MHLEKIHLDVPKTVQKTYCKNYLKLIRESGKLMPFAGDQKVESLNDDFYGELLLIYAR
jgi:hypothetical protein